MAKSEHCDYTIESQYLNMYDKQSVQIIETFTWQNQDNLVIATSENIHEVQIMDMFIQQKRSDVQILM